MEIEIIKLRVNSDKIIAWLKANIPWRLKSQTASTSWQHRHSFSVYCGAISTLAPNTRVTIFPVKESRFIASPPSLLYHGRIFYDWIYSILAQIGNLYVYFLKPLHKKWSFPLRISSVNVAKSTVLVTLTEEILNGKPHFCAVKHIYTNQEKCKRISCGKQWIYKIFYKVYCAEGFWLSYTHPILYPKCIVNEIQTTVKPNKLCAMTVYRHDLHNGVMASCHNLVKVLSTEFLWHG